MTNLKQENVGFWGSIIKDVYGDLRIYSLRSGPSWVL